MKKTLCFLVVFALLLSFCACKNDKKSATDEDVVDLEYYINLGQMPESKFPLSANADEVINSAGEDEGEKVEPYQTGKRTAINIDQMRYYFDTDKKAEGINYIVSFDGGYGFKQGEPKSELQKTLSKRDLNAKPEVLSQEETFFFVVSGEFEGIKYSFGENTACFIFDNDQLCAVALYKNYKTDN